jgi:hypothetical protein
VTAAIAANLERTQMSRITRVVVALGLAGASLVAGAGVAPSADAAGATQVSGVGLPGAPPAPPCDEPAYAGADYTLVMTGDLVGCVYGFITEARFHESSGTYHEIADEVFVGTYFGRPGTFGMTENFSAKYDLTTGAELFGRCQHPIVKGSGTGGFVGVSGRLDFKDDVVNVLFPYRGHLSF